MEKEGQIFCSANKKPWNCPYWGENGECSLSPESDSAECDIFISYFYDRDDEYSKIISNELNRFDKKEA